MTGWDFAGQNLTNAILDLWTLTNTNLTGANLANANLVRSSLTNVNLTGTNLKGATLESAFLSSAVFSAQTLYNQWTIFPSDFNPETAGLTFMPSSAGDFDPNDVLDASDVDLLAKRIRGEVVLSWLSAMFDLDSSLAIDAEDHRIWVQDLKKTWFGDANLDGLFNSGDLVSVLAAGQYEDGVAGNSSWATGDWNGDGEFDRADLVVALQDGGYGQGPRVAVTVVPEPASHLLVLAVLLVLGLFRAHRLRRG